MALQPRNVGDFIREHHAEMHDPATTPEREDELWAMFEQALADEDARMTPEERAAEAANRRAWAMVDAVTSAGQARR